MRLKPAFFARREPTLTASGFVLYSQQVRLVPFLESRMGFKDVDYIIGLSGRVYLIEFSYA